MNEIAKLVSEKTGLPPEVTIQVVDVVFNHVKGRLPPMVAGELDKVIETPTPAPGAAPAASQSSNLEGELLNKAEGMLGGFFGDKQS